MAKGLTSQTLRGVFSAMAIKRIIFLIFPLVFFSLVSMSLAEAARLPVINIGIVFDGPAPERENDIGQLVKQEILALTEGEFDVRFPNELHVRGEWTRSSIKVALGKLLRDPRVDLILALDPVASDIAAHQPTLSKPVVATVIIDANLQNIPVKKGTSGVRNLNYLSAFRSIERDVAAFLAIKPFKKLVVLATGTTLEGIPQLRAKGQQIAEAAGIEIEMIQIAATAQEALQKLPADAEAVYVTPNPHMTAEELQRLAQGLIERHLPSFSYLGRREVKQGLLASIATEADTLRFARRIALNVQRILLGEDAGDLPVAFSQSEHYSINMATARAIDVSPNWDILAEAELLNEEITDVSRRLSLEKVAHEAVAVSLDLQAGERELAAGAQDVRQARSNLLPQLDIAAQGMIIDEDRAQTSFGGQAERTTSGSFTGSQVIYSEKAWANLEIQNHLQDARVQGYDSLSLNVVQETTIAYLNVLRAKTFEGIQKENLRVTRSNLELARIRQSIGYSGPAEVYRWESEAAINRQDLLKAEAQRRQAEIVLNRLLNRPQEEPFIAEDASIDDPALLAGDKRVLGFTRNPRDFALFRDFMVRDGMDRSPELHQLDAAIAAHQRALASTRSAFWSPDIVVQAGVTETFNKGGAGADVTSPFGGTRDDTDWNVALVATLPLSTGGSRRADSNKAHETLVQLQTERRAVRQRIEANIRNAIHQVGASHGSIALSEKAASAAQKNMELVTEAYSQGAVANIQLIDAQQAALVARLGAADARYQFLIDLMNTQRATGRFSFFMSDAERADWFNRLQVFFAEAKK